MPDRRTLSLPRTRSAVGAKADQQVQHLWAVQIIEHPSGTSGRGAQIRLHPSHSNALRNGEVKPEELIGTLDAPGILRRKLASILPALCLNPECTVRVVVQDSMGRVFSPENRTEAVSKELARALRAIDEGSD